MRLPFRDLFPVFGVVCVGSLWLLRGASTEEVPLLYGQTRGGQKGSCPIHEVLVYILHKTMSDLPAQAGKISTSSISHVKICYCCKRTASRPRLLLGWIAQPGSVVMSFCGTALPAAMGRTPLTDWILCTTWNAAESSSAAVARLCNL